MTVCYCDICGEKIGEGSVVYVSIDNADGKGTALYEICKECADRLRTMLGRDEK